MTQEQIFPSPQAFSVTIKPKKQRVFNIAQLTLRILVPLFTLGATITTFKSDQTIEMPFGMSFHASYSYSSAIRYRTQLFKIVLQKRHEMCLSVCACFCMNKIYMRMNSIYVFWFHEVYIQFHKNYRTWTNYLEYLKHVPNDDNVSHCKCKNSFM